MQTVLTGFTHNRIRVEKRAFQQNVGSIFVGTGMQTTKDTSHSQRFVVIGNYQGVIF